MLTAALIFAGLAAVLHVYIFVMESLAWTSPRTRATFGTTAQEAETTKLLAFNQGFYNLFLAIVTAIGIVAICLGHTAVGGALIFTGVGSMLAAAVVLLASSPDKARAAVTQGAFPLIAVGLLAVALAS
ncbi:MAG: putative rane protein [Mycobacterium sp.]|jgi:putative membrane protein|nr:putative rane protein [Mycobacterium sp.]